jgi:hypothetical protein
MIFSSTHNQSFVALSLIYKQDMGQSKNMNINNILNEQFSAIHPGYVNNLDNDFTQEKFWNRSFALSDPSAKYSLRLRGEFFVAGIFDGLYEGEGKGFSMMGPSGEKKPHVSMGLKF